MLGAPWRVAVVHVLVVVAGFDPAVANPSHAADLGLRPVWRDPAAVYDALDDGARRSMIQTLDAPLARGEEISREDRIALVRLLRTSPLMKDRVFALEHTERLDGVDRWRERVLTYQRTFNPWDAVQILEDWTKARPSDVEPWIRLGILRLENGVDELERGALAEAERAFRHATELAPDDPNAWRGLAVVRVFEARYAELVDVAEALRRCAPDAPGTHLLEALAMESLGSAHRASFAWERAMACMDAEAAARFADADRLRIEDGSSVFVDELVTPAPSLSDRGWWVRMTEAETLYGRPEQGVPGAETACGQAWLLYGRPEVMRLVTGADVAYATAHPRLSPYREAILGQISNPGAAQHAAPEHWVWLVRLTPDFEFPLVFTRLTRFATWVFDPEIEEDVIAAQRKRGPVRLAHSVPVERALDDAVSLDVAFHAFRSAGGNLRIEAWTATRAAQDDAVDAVRMRVMADDGRQLDEVRTACGPSHLRASLARAVAGIDRRIPGWVHGFGVLLPAGEYLVVVDLIDREGAVVATQDARLRLDPDVVTRRSFDISEPMLCDAYSELGRFGDLPSEFVRYARAVVPNPERRVHPGQREMAVYYEIYGAAVDPDGQTRLDVEYSVYPAAEFDTVLRTARYVDGRIARPRVRMLFPDMKTGVGAEGLVVRGTKVDVSDLEPGVYVMNVLVTDAIARREAERSVVFVVPGR